MLRKRLDGRCLNAKTTVLNPDKYSLDLRLAGQRFLISLRATNRISRGVATTLLVHSFGGGMRTGATPYDLRLGTVSPNVGPEYVTEVLNTLEESLWYVHREGELLRFQTRPNIYRVIAQTAENQPPTAVEDGQGWTE